MALRRAAYMALFLALGALDFPLHLWFFFCLTPIT
jgi:hypothetical protein